MKKALLIGAALLTLGSIPVSASAYCGSSCAPRPTCCVKTCCPRPVCRPKCCVKTCCPRTKCCGSYSSSFFFLPW